MYFSPAPLPACMSEGLLSPLLPEIPLNTSPWPSIRAMICSIGPPGTNCVSEKLISMMPNRVGIIKSSRLRI